MKRKKGSGRTRRFGVLPTNTDTPNVTKTTMRPNLFQSLEIITQFRVDGVGKNLRILSIDNILLPVKEPRWDLELSRILHDGHYPLQFVRV